MGLPFVSILSQMQLVYIFPRHFPKIHSNIIFHSSRRSSKWSLSFKFSTQEFCVAFLLSPVCITCPTHLIFLDFITPVIFDEQCILGRSSLCNFLDHPITSDALLRTFFSNIFNICTSPSVTGQVSQILCVLIFK